MTESTPKELPSSAASYGSLPPSKSSMFVRKGGAWSEVTALDELHFRIRLGGLLRTAWMASVCTGLAARHLSIEQAHARVTHDGSWIVELGVVALDHAHDPMAVAYVDLAEAPAPRDPAPLSLERYALRASSDHGASLFLAIEAPDSLGLLGALLASLAQHNAFPIEMHIETREGRAHDSFWLTTQDGHPASPATVTALEALLQAALRV